MTCETIQYVDAAAVTQEVSLTSLKASRVRMQPASHAPSEFHITITAPPETPVVIPFKSRCRIYACRASADGSPNSFSGGAIIFQGRRTDNSGAGSPGHVSTEIVISDALWDLQQVTFQAVASIISSGTWAAPVLTYYYWPDAVLFMPNPAGQRQAGGSFAAFDPPPIPNGSNTLITTWQQIRDVVNYAINYATGAEGVRLQMGDAPEFTPQYRNTYPVRSVKCLQALISCLQSHPGVFMEIDYSTDIPTLHFRDRAHMAAVTLPYKSTDSDGVMHVATNIQPLYHLRPDRIAIYYKILGSFNGGTIVNFASDIWPAAGGPFLLTQSYSVDITGETRSQTQKDFRSTNFNPADIALWRLKVPSLRQVSEGGQIPNDGGDGALAFIAGSTSVVDDAGNPVNLSTFQYYTDDSVYSWFPGAQAVRATVRARFSYSKNPGGVTGGLTKVNDHAHSFRLLLTNKASGLYTFNQVNSYGEALPPGLAQKIWSELQDLQWKVSHQIIQAGADADTVPRIIKPGRDVVNLTGGDPDWETMNAVPQQVTVDFLRTADGRLVARQNVNCGPADHLEPGYLVQLYNLFANRNLRRIDANQVLSGQVAGGQVDLSATDSRENSVPALPDLARDVVTGATPV